MLGIEIRTLIAEETKLRAMISEQGESLKADRIKQEKILAAAINLIKEQAKALQANKKEMDVLRSELKAEVEAIRLDVHTTLDPLPGAVQAILTDGFQEQSKATALQNLKDRNLTRRAINAGELRANEKRKQENTGRDYGLLVTILLIGGAGIAVLEGAPAAVITYAIGTAASHLALQKALGEKYYKKLGKISSKLGSITGKLGSIAGACYTNTIGRCLSWTKGTRCYQNTIGRCWNSAFGSSDDEFEFTDPELLHLALEAEDDDKGSDLEAGMRSPAADAVTLSIADTKTQTESAIKTQTKLQQTNPQIDQDLGIGLGLRATSTALDSTDSASKPRKSSDRSSDSEGSDVLNPPALVTLLGIKGEDKAALDNPIPGQIADRVEHQDGEVPVVDSAATGVAGPLGSDSSASSIESQSAQSVVKPLQQSALRSDDGRHLTASRLGRSTPGAHSRSGSGASELQSPLSSPKLTVAFSPGAIAASGSARRASHAAPLAVNRPTTGASKSTSRPGTRVAFI